MKEEELKNAVRESYARVAKAKEATEGKSSCCSSGCCGSARPVQISKKIGYTEEQMHAVPAGANLGLGCGNPIALASLKEGETVAAYLKRGRLSPLVQSAPLRIIMDDRAALHGAASIAWDCLHSQQ